MKKLQYFVLGPVLPVITLKKQSFRYNLILYCNRHADSVLDEYTRHRLLFAIRFRFTFSKQVATANWLTLTLPSPVK